MRIITTQILLSMLTLLGPAHAAGLTAKITLPDGATRVARLEGVGCSAAICSRVSIKGLSHGDSVIEKRLQAIGAIKDTNADHALFVFKDGSTARLSLLKDFRVLYLAKPSGGTEKLDLAHVKSVEILGASQ